MLASIIITDADEASARAHHSSDYEFIACEVRCSNGNARAASLCISPAVARQLRDAIDRALDDLAVRDNEASETEASHADP